MPLGSVGRQTQAAGHSCVHVQHTSKVLLLTMANSQSADCGFHSYSSALSSRWNVVAAAAQLWHWIRDRITVQNWPSNKIVEFAIWKIGLLLKPCRAADDSGRDTFEKRDQSHLLTNAAWIS